MSEATYPRSPRWRAVAALALSLPLMVGCPTEVQYGEPEETIAQSAPDPAESTAANLPEPSADLAEPEVVSADPETSTPAELPPPASSSPSSGRLPWETESGDDQSTPNLFAGVPAQGRYGQQAATDPVEASPEADPVEPGDDAEPESDFQSFLDQAYAGIIDKKPEEPGPVAEEAEDPEPSESKAPIDFNMTYEEMAAELPEIPAKTSATPPRLSPKPPAPAVAAEADSLNDLWRNEAPSKELPPPPKKPMDVPVEESLASVTSSEPERPEEPELTAVEDKVEQGGGLLPWEVDSETTPPEPEPEPEPSSVAELPPPNRGAEEPPAIAPPPEAEAPADPAPRMASAAPLASAAIDPLPKVPVLTFNTRHLAWLLGGKLGLAELADLDGATPAEVAAWRDEVARLAGELHIDDPLSSNQRPEDPAARVAELMSVAARAGDELSQQHGLDHAALLEISLKSNALLVIADRRSDLAGPVAGAIRSAADRAMLPRFLWEDTVRELSQEPTADEAHDAVVRLHERVERFLR